jgi:indole-3-glycerol phosphate synthase
MSVLDQIIEGVRADLAERERVTTLDDLRRLVDAVEPPLDPMPTLAAPGVSVIAEVKRRSPSKGDLAAIPDPAALARAYEAGGAAAVSVLTEGRRFGGSLEDLRAVRKQVAIPVLRKDFMVTTYQLWEARAAGADLVLLIVAALDQPTLERLHAEARGLGLTVLVEVHDPSEVERALAAGATLLGVNARNLKTLDVDPGAFARIAPSIPTDVVAVAESGIAGPDDVRTLTDAGADAVLVGEALVRGGDPRSAVAEMTAAGARADRPTRTERNRP